MDEGAKSLKDVLGQQLQERGGFAAGDDEAVDAIEVVGLADEGDGRPEFFEAAAVSVESRPGVRVRR